MRTFTDIVQQARQQESYWIESALYDFTETICELMERSNMNRTELARKLGVSPAYITKLLRGYANMTIKTMVRLARVLGRDLQIILPQKAAFQPSRVPIEKRISAPPQNKRCIVRNTARQKNGRTSFAA